MPVNRYAAGEPVELAGLIAAAPERPPEPGARGGVYGRQDRQPAQAAKDCRQRAESSLHLVSAQRTVLQHGGEVTEGRAKTKAGERRIYLDAESVRRYRQHRRGQLAERLRASTAWQDNDLIFCRADGSPWPPDYVSRLCKAYAREAGVPIIKLHKGRHSAASLARDAGVDAKIRREQLGHTTGSMTDHYTHVLAEAHVEAAEAVARHVEEAGP